jgi:hypothetical protein
MKCYGRWQRLSNCDVLRSSGDGGKYIRSTVASPSVSEVLYYVCVNNNLVHCLIMRACLLYGAVEEQLHAFLISALHVKWLVSFTHCSLLLVLIGRRLVSITASLDIFHMNFTIHCLCFPIHHSPIGLCNGSTVLSMRCELDLHIHIYTYVYMSQISSILTF